MIMMTAMILTNGIFCWQPRLSRMLKHAVSIGYADYDAAGDGCSNDNDAAGDGCSNDNDAAGDGCSKYSMSQGTAKWGIRGVSACSRHVKYKSS